MFQDLLDHLFPARNHAALWSAQQFVAAEGHHIYPGFGLRKEPTVQEVVKAGVDVWHDTERVKVKIKWKIKGAGKKIIKGKFKETLYGSRPYEPLPDGLQCILPLAGLRHERTAARKGIEWVSPEKGTRG